jgi:hypothetical protein
MLKPVKTIAWQRLFCFDCSAGQANFTQNGGSDGCLEESLLKMM